MGDRSEVLIVSKKGKIRGDQGRRLGACPECHQPGQPDPVEPNVWHCRRCDVEYEVGDGGRLIAVTYWGPVAFGRRP